MSGTTRLTTLHHMPLDLHPQKHRLTAPNLASAFYLVMEMKDMDIALWRDEIKMAKSKEDEILGQEKQP